MTCSKCENKAHARGFCQIHYRVWYKQYPELVNRRLYDKALRSDSLFRPNISEGLKANICSLVRALR